MIRTDWDSYPLGEYPDGLLAEMAGVGSNAVCQARKRRGIAACPTVGVDWDSQPLGEMIDRELAERLGVTTVRVYQARKARGIVAFSKRGRV